MRNKRTLILMALVGVIIALVQSHRSAVQAYADRKLSREQILTTMVNEIRARTIFDAIDQVARRSKIPIRCDWKQLEAASIDRDSEFKVTLYDVTLEECLNVICNSYDMQTRLDWRWEGATIVISTAEDVCRYQVTLRVHDVRDLVSKIATDASAPRPSMCFNGNKGSGGGPGLFGGSVIDAYQGSVNEATDSLIRLIQDTVSSDSWRDCGGTVGSISVLDGRLLIMQSNRNHDAIARLLDLLRADVKCD